VDGNAWEAERAATRFCGLTFAQWLVTFAAANTKNCTISLMNTLVPIVLYGWLPVVLLIFRELKGHRAVVFSVVAATLFLPVAELSFYGLPEWSKASATSISVLLAALIFAPKALLRFRFRWFDLPVVVYCLSPIPAALSNSLGVMHGISLSLDNIFMWGLPYFIGRVFFLSLESIRDLAFGIFVGGLVYVPFCLFEVRMSPKLHRLVYGAQVGSWSVIRFDGYRPSVFMQQGLEVGMYMTAASLLGIWLWRCRQVRRVWGIDVSLLMAVLLVTTILCKSTGAILLLIAGLTVLFVSRVARTPLPVIALALIPFVYIGVRSTGLYDGSIVVSLARELVGEDRAQSLQFRFANEDILVERALQMPWFGWGGFGRNRVYDEFGKDLSITDGLWIITLGHFGILGLFSLYGMLTIVPVLAPLRFWTKGWNWRDVGPVFAISALLLLYTIDCLLNAMVNAVYPLCLGAISAVYGQRREKLLPEDLTLDLIKDDGAASPIEKIASRRRLWPPARPGSSVVVQH
jgi:hypothetical protein